ncbi:MAG: hypothetical protein U9N40_04360 [Euryarchaeota archaeon]|nr:hypothetical protein [Euryarchaeota archaeon]
MIPDHFQDKIFWFVVTDPEGVVSAVNSVSRHLRNGWQEGAYQMADFIQTTNTRSAVWDLSVPIADITVFNAIVQDISSTQVWSKQCKTCIELV